MFGLNIEEVAKQKIAAVEKKIEAIDLDHNGKSDLIEAKQLIEEGIAGIKEVEALIPPGEIAAALHSLFPSLTAEGVAKGEVALNKVLAGIAKAEALLPAVKTAL